MPDHIDKQLRDAATALLTGLTTTGSRIYKSRVYPMRDADLPGLRIYVDESSISVASLGGAKRYQERTISLVVEFCAKATSSYDDQADASKKEIEIAIGNANTITSTVKYAQLARIETERSGEGEQVLMMTRLTFDCVAYTAMNAPDVAL